MLVRRETSLLREGHNCCSITRAGRAVLLVDGEAYFAAFRAVAERAERSILIVGWDFDSRTPLAFDGESPTVLLGDFLNGLCRRRRQLRVRVLDWDYPMLFASDREFPPLYGLAWKPHRRVHFHYDGTNAAGGSHHQKIVVIDDRVAFVGGLDLTARRWDTRGHRAGDPRRRVGGTPYPPFHDMMLAVDGEAARALGAIARERWTRATGHRLERTRVASDPWPGWLEPDLRDVRVGFACTTPHGERGAGKREIEQLYLDMIARARRSIYIENQYFTAERLGEALAARLAEPDGPEVVVVTRYLSHGWLEEMTMHVLRTRLVRRLREADRHHRFRIYYPDVAGLEAGTCVDVHSKTMIVDDEWLRIGSSNFSNRSMGLDTECDAVIEAEGDPRVQAVVRRLRHELLAEHLGTTAQTVETAVERGGSLHAAIDTLGSPERDLKPLGEVEEWSEAVIATVAIADPERPVSLDTLVAQFAPDIEVRHARPLWQTAGVALLALGALAFLWRYTPLAQLLTPEAVDRFAAQLAGAWWAPLALMAAYAPASVVMFPRPLITLAAVIAFGPWIGFALAMTGVLLAAAGTYAIGRSLERDTVRRIAGERLNRMTQALRANGVIAMTAVRLVPIAPFVVVNVVAGAIRIDFWRFIAGTFLGMLPGTLAATVFAQELQAFLDDPGTVRWGLLAAVVAAVAAVAFLLRRRVRGVPTASKAISTPRGDRQQTLVAPSGR
jgi:phosphatidylserine/phosphatidylglycerophosphate/cardiolipin synthase-like enzyme/uncharacterized membrane protein YdjX (TVP38/TMEM64 family)